MKSFSVILIFIICLTGCFRKAARNNNSNSATPTPISNYTSPTNTPKTKENYPANFDTPVSPPSLYEEAEQEAQKWFNARVHQCGQYYRAAVQEGSPNNVWFAVMQNKPSFMIEGEELSPRILSEADRLNGVDPQPVEWEGKIKVSFGPYRINPTFRWQNDYKVENVLYKKKGKWFTTEDQKIFQRTILLSFRCDQIPANLKTE